MLHTIINSFIAKQPYDRFLKKTNSVELGGLVEWVTLVWPPPSSMIRTGTSPRYLDLIQSCEAYLSCQQDLVELIVESNQELPSWLEAMGLDHRGNYGGGRRGGGR